MRKYQQLLLLVTCFVCVITLLFYRHEYLKLRSILSVLNFFGNTAINSTCLTFSYDIKVNADLKYKFNEPRSVWTKLENHYIYSSYLINSDPKFIKTIAIGPRSTFYDYKCRVWFEEGDILISKYGTFKYNLDVLDNNKSSNLNFKYTLKCIITDKPEEGIPYGVLWISSQNTSKFFPISVQQQSSSLTDSVICIMPDYSGLPKTHLVEFISYYNILGVNNFIIYDTGIQHTIFPFFESVSGNKNILQSVVVLPWNFPIYDASLEYLALKYDCLSRTFGKSKLIGLLKWNEYIIMKNFNISAIVSSHNSHFINVNLSSWLCCTNLPDEKLADHSWPLVLRKTHCIKENVKEKLFVNLGIYDISMNAETIINRNAEVRKFDTCENTVFKLRSVFSISRLHSHFLSHELLILWKSRKNSTLIFN